MSRSSAYDGDSRGGLKWYEFGNYFIKSIKFCPTSNKKNFNSLIEPEYRQQIFTEQFSITKQIVKNYYLIQFII